MINTIAKCGCDCFNCPTYKDNLLTFDDRVRCSTGWHKHLNLNLKPEKIRTCDGCSIPDAHRKIYYLNCKVRRCAITNGFDNCAFCQGFPCEELSEVHSIQRIKNRKEFIEKSGKVISEKEYRRFIEPYTGINHLFKIRQKLTNSDIKKYKTYSFSQFSNSSNKFSGKREEFSKITSLLSKICIEDNMSYARFLSQKERRRKMMKILWTMGIYGKFGNSNSYIELDSKTFLAQKIISIHSVLHSLFTDLKKYNIQADIIPLLDNEWLTPSGGLRKKGWKIKFSFGQSPADMRTLKQFMKYTTDLKNNFSGNGFRMFNRLT